MDTTKTYILMCEKAVEVQELWEVLDGDFFYRDDSFSIVSHLNWKYLNQQKRLRFLRYIWLPRQDQLQGMIKDRYKVNYGIDLYHLIKCFQIFQVKHTGGLGLTSMEQLWLAFVMKEKFNKTWNGSEWK